MGIDYFLTYKSPKPLAILISEKLEKLLDDMERNLGFVLSDGKNLDWNDVLSGYGAITEWFGHNLCHNKPITNIKTVLNIHMVINRYEEELYDIVDAKERNNRFFELLNSHDYKPDILPDDKIKQYRVLAQKLKREKEGRAISTFLAVESDVREIAQTVERCACDLDGWIQLQIDIALGK